uniref:Hemicentin 1 n=1 Tax=Oncorhynchus kisutch TaxID=8019 RepID=A0A8C7JTX3_ONCKI
MGIKRVPLLLVQVLLLVAVSSGQNTGTEGTKEEIPEGASTLAFVFDVTGSMYDDLVQVIEGASKILEMSQSRTKRPLYNYALVPFHDPEIGPVTITTDPKKFQFELRELYVQGGGDCPEMSIGAIKIALEISLPGSFIYVFTDARSKDYKLTQEVLQLIQQKQSQVVFVLTGDCDDRAHIGYKVYEEIASTSSGQVFHLDKKQVNEVLKWVEEAVQSSKVHLLSTDHYNGVSNTWPIPFDPSLKEVTVALSGPAPDIEIRNPQGRPLDGLTELLHIPNSARVVNIKDPEPGMWSIKTSSEGRHSVRISGVSTIDFRAGFSRKPTLDFKMTSSRPVQGIATYILLNTTGLSHPARADRLELVSITGGVIKTLPVRYYPNTGTGSPLTGTIWNITEFVPPKEAFFLRVTGYDKDGFLFQRVSSVSFSSIVPGQLPGLTVVLSVAKGSGQVVHYIRNLGGSQESANALWDLAQVTLTDEGFYECIAISNAGTGHARTFLDPPPAITVGGNVTATPGSSAVLTCHVASTVQFNLTWHRGGVDARLDPRRRPLANLSLDINSIGPDDAGWYECVATNEGGVSIERIYLIVQEPPQVSVDPRHQTFTTGQEVRIRCSARGYPAPHLVWTHNDILPLSYSHPLVSCLLPESPVVIVVLSEILIGLGETTILACSASGIPQPEIRWFKGKVSAPQFTREPSDVAADIGSNVTLPCHVQGYPEPQITWRREDNAPIFTRHLWVEDETVYVCEAQNQFGRIQTHARVTVTGLVYPVIGHSPGVLNVIKEQQVTLPCVLLAGNPLPERRWLHNHGLVSSSPYVTVRRDGSLHIEHVRLEEGGEYTCLAENVLGSSNHTTTLNIYAGPRVLKVQVEHPVDLPCVARGVPQPFLAWLKDGSALVVDGTHYRTSLDGSLTLGQVGLSDQGTYTCLATSIAGRDQANVQLQVQGESLIPPVVDVLEPPFNSPHQERVANQRIAFPCPAKGTPTPVIKWLRNGQELTGNEPGLTIMEDGTLLILASVSQLDNGEYVCTAANEAGTTQKKYQLKVNVPPDLRDNGSPGNVSVVLNQPTNLVCDVTGSPVPVITWYKDGVPVGELILHSYTGSYSCKAINIAGSTEKDFLLEVLVPPTIVGTGSPRDVSAVLNQEISLDCKVKGTPFPTIQWYKDRKLVFLGDPNIEVSNKGQTLKIKSARLGDQAHYQCSVTNAAGKQTKDFNLSVYVPPTIKGGNVTSEVTTLLDNVVMLECEARGVPLPAITWYRNGEAILSSYQAQYVDRGHFLRIPRAQASDTGQFSCRVTSVAGTAEKNFELDVYLPPSIKGGQDTATERKVVLTKPLNLECEVGGHPPPTLTWLKDGVPVRNGESINILEQGRKIEILSASVSDAGRYVCVATSVAGEKEINYDVSVLGTVEVGSLHTYTLCRATGTPSPILTQGEGVRVTANGRRLVISRPQVSDTARFQCVATNEAGDHKRDFNVAVHGIHTAVVLETHTFCDLPLVYSPFGKYSDPLTFSTFCYVTLESAGRTLHITEARLEDAGRYTCVATNAAGETQQHMRLSVHGNSRSKTPQTLTRFLFLSDGRPLTSAAGVTILKRGQLLEIDRAQLSDAGLYRCIAVNVAGTSELSHRLQVYVPPAISSRSAMVTVVVNDPARLECEATGVPLPSLTWLKDGSPVASVSDGIQVLSGGTVLSLSSAQVSDTGKYTCVAVNAGGEQQREYDLRVYVPPNIMGEEVNATVMLGRSVELRCQSDAIPPPTLSWRKDGRPLFRKPGLTVSEDGSVLKVRAQVQDSGRYTCEATNIAGKTEKNYNLNVWGELLLCLSVCLSACLSAFVYRCVCVFYLSGSELKSDSRVRALSGGRQLQISGAERTDSASYTCIASNAAGNAAKEYSLQVYVRPSIRLNITLQCEADGVPRPAVTWLKDGRPITGQRGAQVLNEGRLLQIKDAKVWDTGRYTCVAVNVAGQADSKHDVNVHVPPSISGQTQVPENVSVVVNNPVALTCEASGIPLPAITWLKDGRPIRASILTCLSGGRSLRLMHAAVEDAGRYSCIVSNTAGEERKNFDLDILVPPSIVDEGTVQDAKVKEKHNVTLTCEVAGNPVPEITWLKDGQSLGTDRRHQVLSHGRYLQISGAQVDDTGRYSCLAHNRAGDRSRHFNLNVLVSPTIVGSGPEGSAEEVTVTLSSPTSLVCEVQSYPPALITWLKDGTPLESSHNVRVLPGGRTLQILNAKEEDAGRYTCVATNEAGDSLKNYEVKVYIPPQINKNDVPGEGLAPKEVKIKVNNTLTLECEAQAIPTPSLQWYKDGQVNDHVTINANGRTVRIKHAQVSDTGRYTCVATNIAGEDEKDFDINIQVPPSFQRPGGVGDTTSTPGTGGDVKDVVLNNPISLYCETNAVPPPTLTWYKDGRPMASNENVLIMPGGRVLQIPRAQAEDSGRYTCLAVNEAGEDSIQYDVRVLVPPSIRGVDRDLPEEMVIQVNKTTVLECQADGSPTPKITWLKDSQPISPKGPHRLLQVVCFLSPPVPPTIVGASPENVTVVVNNFVSLTCEATGFPPPSLSWVKDRGPVQANTNALIMPGNTYTTLHTLLDCSLTPCVSFSYPSSFSCLPYTAPVHSITKILLSPLPLPWLSPVPPSIRDSSGDSPVVVSVRVGNSVTLECESNAVPPPTITWYKNGRMVTESANLRILAQGQMLELKGAEVRDTEGRSEPIDRGGVRGREAMRCDWMGFVLFLTFLLKKIVETISNPVTFACDATGIPPPSLIWLKNGRTIESLELHILSGGSKLQIARSQLSDSGTYTCMASNVEGKARKSYHLTIQVPPSISGSEMPSEVGVLLNDSVQLVCRSQGTPPPSIQWLKDGKALKAGSRGLRISLDGSTLTVSGAHTSDSGKYTCVATNKAGEEDRIFNLNVYVPPVIKGNSDTAVDLTTVLDSSINIECVAVGYPPPQLNWLKNGLPLPVSSQIRLLSGGQVLRIARAQLSDGGTFTCVASNRAGVDNRHYNLQVHVPPSLDGVGSKEDVTVVRGNLASLLCIADGTPSPSMSWMREGEALVPGPHIKLLNVGTTVQIIQARVEDTGRYTCVARNSAGQASRHFHLKVLDPPRINGSGVAAEVSVVVNHVLELLCEATGIPAPTLTWMKDGRPLPQTDSLRDTGRYTCLANSPAGDDDKDFLVRVHVPPNIAGESTPQNVSVLQNRQVTLECKSDAVPPPALTWPDVPLLSPNIAGKTTRQFNLAVNGTELRETQVTDTGRYLCMATNQAGTQRKRVDLQVHVPPSISRGPTNITVTVNVQTTLSCEATGIPKPTVSWTKNGQTLNTDHNQNMYRLLSSGSLVVIAPTVEDTAEYECVVSNEAGEEARAIQLTVQVPPSIADEATELVVSRLSPLVIGCTASGVPEPMLQWSKDGMKLPKEGNSYSILSSGAIEITSSELSHSGRYSCVAKNAAGSAHRHVQLTVQEVPVIQVHPSTMDVIVNNPITLPCRATGSPLPTITWQKEGINIPSTGRLRVLSSGSLQIAFAQPGDTGRYTCTAANAAGTSSLEMSLTVQIPPSIRRGESEVSVVENSQAQIACVAEGVPQPTLSWEKEGTPLSDTSGEYTILPSGELVIDIAQPDDEGSYTCVATNTVGQDSQTVRLSVHTQPAFTELLADMALNKGERLVMACGVTGIPPPKITWAFNNIIIPAHYDHVNGHSELVIERVTKDNSGTYSCIAENRVGTIKSLGFVYVKEPPIIDGDFHSNRIEPLGGNAILNCEVRGDPLPTIQWSKKGVNIQISNRIHQLDNGSLAIYGTVNEDAGNYMCVATNDAGVVEKSVTLTLQSSPSITVEPVETVVDAGTTVLLNCRAEGEPTPVIEWSRQGSPLLGNERFTTLSNGSLRLTSAQKEDTAEYQCVARNLLGSVLVRVTLTVRGGPQKARGSIIGNINNVEFGIAILNATISDNQSGGRVIHATISNVPRSLGPAMRKLISILNSIYWTTAQELGEAVNGYSLTRGVFRRETQVEFATGEILRMTHVARGLDSDGALLLDIVLNGHILQLPSNDYTEDYIQTGPGQLYALSTRMFSIDRVSVPYSWNHTITYDPAKGKMPYLVETLHASAISAHYRPLEEVLEYKLHATITKGDRSNQCPVGFRLDSAGPYCADEDECKERSPCSHVCHNAMGTYYCSCPRGLTISADGRTCQDIDECSLGGHMCHDGQDCENTIGSYRCVMRCGRGFRRTADGHSCQDIDECRDGTHQCRYNQICENSRGSYHCTCPRGYRSQGVGRPCVDSNECEHAPQPCAHQCLNTPGSFKCVCPPGRHLLGDGKSCAGLENASTTAWPLRATPPTLPQGGAIGSVDAGRPWPVRRDINECEVRDTCQHECMNTPGSHRCQCPAGYRLMTNGKTCQDIDECLEQNVQCGTNRMCFNMRGSYQCIDTPCPPNYQRDPATGFCLKKCPPNDLECALSPYALEYKLLSLPFGIAANQDLIRLVAYTQDGVVHPRTSFLVVDEDVTLPFALRDENLKGVLFTTRALREPHTFRMKVRSLSYSADGGIEYQTTFIVYIAVSAYPY